MQLQQSCHPTSHRKSVIEKALAGNNLEKLKHFLEFYYTRACESGHQALMNFNCLFVCAHAKILIVPFQIHKGSNQSNPRANLLKDLFQCYLPSFLGSYNPTVQSTCLSLLI